MVRTRIVELLSMEAVAFRKREKNGFLIVVKNLSDGACAAVLLDRETKGLIPVGNVDESVFTPGVFEEAMALTTGLPLLQRPLPQVSAGPEDEEPCTLLKSRDYHVFLRAYTDDTGRLDFDLLKGDMDRLRVETGKTGLPAFQVLLSSITGKDAGEEMAGALMSLIEDASLTPIF